MTSHLIGSIDWVWCHGPADAPPTPGSGSWSMPTTNYSYTLSYSSNVLLLCCTNSLRTHDVYCIWRGILLCCSPEGFFPFFPVKGCFPFFGEFFLIRCEVLGQGCCMCTDCKAIWGTFVILGYKKQTELNKSFSFHQTTWSMATHY